MTHTNSERKETNSWIISRAGARLFSTLDRQTIQPPTYLRKNALFRGHLARDNCQGKPSWCCPGLLSLLEMYWWGGFSLVHLTNKKPGQENKALLGSCFLQRTAIKDCLLPAVAQVSSLPSSNEDKRPRQWQESLLPATSWASSLLVVLAKSSSVVHPEAKTRGSSSAASHLSAALQVVTYATA